MEFHRNEFGVPQYPESDARRLLVLLASIDLLERPTAAAIADLTSCGKEEIDEKISRLQEQFGVIVRRVGDVYHIDSWGNVLKKQGVKRFIKNTG